MAPPRRLHANPITPGLMPGAEETCRRVQITCAIGALIIALANLAVWLGPARALGSIPGVFVIRLNTAICIGLAAISLLLWYFSGDSPFRTKLAKAVGWCVAVIAGLTAIQDICGVSFGVDHWFGPSTFAGDQANRYVVHPGRMSFNAALSLLLLGLGLANLDVRFSVKKIGELYIAPGLLLIASLPAMCGIVGYVVGAGGFTGLLKSTNILLHTAVALVGLSIGALLARPHRSPVNAVFSAGADGLLLRWMLPGSAMVLIVMAWTISHLRKGGGLLPGEGTALMLYGGLVLLSLLIFTGAKIVARKEAAANEATAAKIEGESRFRALADNISQLAWIADAKGRISWVNKRWVEYTGMDAEQIEAEGWEGLLHCDHRARVVAKLNACFRDGVAWEDDFPMRRHGGEHRWFLASAMPIADEEGNVERWFGTLTDVTDQRTLSDELTHAKDRAEKASQAKDDFLAALSHELRTPLTPVLLSAAALSQDERLPTDVREDLARMERNIALEGKLIDDLLDLTRIARGKMLLRDEACDVHALISDAISIVRSEAEAKHVALEIDLNAKESGLSGDPARLQQIIWNVLKNAVKFTNPGGAIAVRTRDSQPSGGLIIEIEDNGLGFPRDAADRLFQPFQQEKALPEHRFGGLGLGLSISRAIAEAHGGSITAESAGLGAGATFRIRLPGAFEYRLTPSAEPITSSGDRPAERSLNVTLVEDHEATIDVLSRLLRQRGHAVRTGRSVLAGRTALDAGPCDVLISDIGLPDGTGHDVLRHAREVHPDVYAIALSGYGMEADLDRSRDAGFEAHLVKPVELADLLSALKEFEKKRSNPGAAVATAR